MIIDSHCHAGQVWYEPAETLLFQMDRCGVARALLVQMLGQYNNEYQKACLERWPDRFINIVGVDPADPGAPDQLRRLAERGAQGVRLRPTARSLGADPWKIWRTAEYCRLAISCVGTTAQFTAPSFSELVSSFPDLPIVLEHLGGVARPDADETIEDVWALARFPNIFLKVPGLGQLSKRLSLLPAEGSPFEPGAEATLRRAVNAFSARRLMWGSDFPVVASREGYANSLAGMQACLSFLPTAELNEIFGGTAARVFDSESWK
jgi:L-fuconolactonase